MLEGCAAHQNILDMAAEWPCQMPITTCEADTRQPAPMMLARLVGRQTIVVRQLPNAQQPLSEGGHYLWQRLTGCLVNSRFPYTTAWDSYSYGAPRRWVVERTFAWISKHRPRLRAPPGQPRSHDLVGHDRPHGMPPDPAQPFIAVMRPLRGLTWPALGLAALGRC